MNCPLCLQPMEAGYLRSRGYATVFIPDESKRTWLPPPFDVVTRFRLQETTVVGYLTTRAAYCCTISEAITVPHSTAAAGTWAATA